MSFLSSYRGPYPCKGSCVFDIVVRNRMFKPQINVKLRENHKPHPASILWFPVSQICFACWHIPNRFLLLISLELHHTSIVNGRPRARRSSLKRDIVQCSRARSRYGLPRAMPAFTGLLDGSYRDSCTERCTTSRNTDASCPVLQELA